MKYTMSYREKVTLADGAKLQLRAIRPSDKAALAEGFARLSPDSRRQRFHTAKAALSDAELQFLTECDGQTHFAIVAFCNDESTGVKVGVGVARFVSADGEPAVAELGITVADAWQGRGLGAVLLQRIVAAASERGHERIRAVIQADNEKMKSLIEASVDRPSYDYENGYLVVDYPIYPTSSIDGTLRALRRLTAGTMTIPMWLGEQTLRAFLQAGRKPDE